jgi:hypothetical protein
MYPLHFVLANFISIALAARFLENPDNCFRPRDIQSPPGLQIGNTGVLYPNFAVEVAKSNESFQRLKDDAEAKHFSAMSGIVLYLGIKIFDYQRMRVVLLERDTAAGSGYINPPLAETGYIDVTTPCANTIIIPKRFVYYGVPPPLISSTVTPDYILTLELVRREIFENWGT